MPKIQRVAQKEKAEIKHQLGGNIEYYCVAQSERLIPVLQTTVLKVVFALKK